MSSQLLKALVIISAFSFSVSGFTANNEKLTESYFSPRQGKLVFEKMYKAISSAKSFVHISIYSWSDGKIKDSLIKASKNGADVRVLLMKKLSAKARVQKWTKEMELEGVEVKIAGQSGGAMHEKMILIDDKLVINSSANMSTGPKSKYSENWIFHFKNPKIQNIFDDFNHEFSILWNSGYDVITNGEDIADALDMYRPGTLGQQLNNLPDSKSDSPLYSMSMNHTLKENKVSSADYKKGKYIKLVKRKDSNRKQTWLVRDRIIKELDNAQDNISCAFNHLFISEIAEALVNASERGINVRLAVDNQEYTSGKTREFVSGWKKIKGNKNKEAPVRLKYYSLAPSPAVWFLNHHKFCVVDYGKDKATLISGSYNFSLAAEQKQFDNQVFYSGKKFSNLYESFQGEFDHLYNENRDEGDKPNKEILEYFKTPNSYGGYPIHNYKTPTSLKWSEVKKLRAELNKLAPGIIRTNMYNRDCKSYKFIKYNVSENGRKEAVGKYFGCPPPRR